MKKIYLLFLMISVCHGVFAQTFDFASATVTSAPIGYQQTGVGTYYKSTTGGTISFGTTSCDGFSVSAPTSGSLLVFQTANDIASITLRGTGTGSNRTFSSLTTSTTLGGTYNATNASATGTISGTTCGSIVITPAAAITAGTFMKITLSGNLNITSIVFTPANFPAPTVQTSNINFSGVSPVSMNINWTNGDGTARAVFVKAVGQGTISNPSDGTAYTASSDWSVPGTQLGSSGYYCVYSGTGTSVTLTNLAPSTTYWVQAFEYNGSGLSSKYLVTTAANNPNSQQTAVAAPTITALPSPLNFGDVRQNSVSAELTYTLSGIFLTPATGNLSITAPSGYEVSLSTGSGFSSSLSIPYSAGTLSNTTIYVHLKPTALVTYSGTIDNSGGGATLQSVTVSGKGVQYLTGDYMSVATGNWGTNTTWNKWDGSSWVASTDFPNSLTASVYVDGGFTVTDDASARSCFNLYIQNNSTLKSSNKVNSPVYLKIYGNTVKVDNGSLMGVASQTLGDAADGLSIDFYGTGTNPALLITGNGGIIGISRLRTNTAGSQITIDNDVTLNYHGSSNAGNAAGFYTVAGDNNSLTINAGKTLTFAPWSCYTPVGNSHTNGGFAETINVNGTLTFMSGNPAPDTVTVSRIGWHNSGYFSLGVTGKTVNLNIGATGVLNVTEFYPQGTKADNSPGTGDLINIAVAAGGVINNSKVVDFRKQDQVVTGGGTVNVLAGDTLKIGSLDGIQSIANSGHIQTGTRNFSSGAYYEYSGIAAQNSGTGLPAAAKGLVIKNAAGVTLTTPSTVTESFKLLSGNLTTTGLVLLTIDNTATISGGSASSFVNGPLVMNTNHAVNYVFPVGKGTVYHPCTVLPSTGNAGSYQSEYFNTAYSDLTLDASLLGVSNTEYWDIRKISGPDAYVLLDLNGTPIPGGTALNYGVVAHYTGANWTSVANSSIAPGNATAGQAVSTLLSGFSPFTFGLVSAPQPVTIINFNAGWVGNKIVTNWTASNEINLQRYQVEKSTDGLHFVSIGSVDALNLINAHHYSFLDPALISETVFYRLASVDQGGRKVYSSIVKVQQKNIINWSLSPNPVKNQLTINYPVAEKGAILNIISSVGKVMLSSPVNEGSVVSTINVEQLHDGVYWLQYINNGSVKTAVFVK